MLVCNGKIKKNIMCDELIYEHKEEVNFVGYLDDFVSLEDNNFSNNIVEKKIKNKRKKIKIEVVRKLVELKGGILLSEKYINSKTKLEVLCELGHTFYPNWDHLKQGSWCKKCSGNTKLTINECQKFAEDKNDGSKCLSTKYINNGTPLHWFCGLCNYTWFASFSDIKGNKNKKGTWCPKCAGQVKPTLREIQIFIKSKKGALLSEKYINNHSELEIKCEFGHIFYPTWHNLKDSNTWCLKCAGLSKPTLKEIQILIESKGGIFLSEKYENAHKKLKIKCKNNHIFEISWDCLTRKNENIWCIDCNIFISELICKYMFEQIFNEIFIKTRPSWLKNPKTKRNLELDGFNKKLNIAFEHQGKHHYKNGVYSKNNNDLENQIYKDQLKVKLCADNNVKLIIIPELFGQTKLKNLQTVIINQCKELNIKLIENIPQIKIDINKIIKKWYGE